MRSLLALLVVSGLFVAGCGPATTSSKKADPPTPVPVVKPDPVTKPVDPAPAKPATKKEDPPKDDKKEEKKDDKKEDKK